MTSIFFPYRESSEIYAEVMVIRASHRRDQSEGQSKATVTGA